MLKKVISFMLSVVLCFSFTVFSYATDEESVLLEEQYHTVITNSDDLEDFVCTTNHNLSG